MRCEKLSGPTVQNLLEVRGVSLPSELIAAGNDEAKDFVQRRWGRIGRAEVIVVEWKGWKPAWRGCEERDAEGGGQKSGWSPGERMQELTACNGI